MKRKRRAMFIIGAMFPSFMLLIIAEFGLRWYENSRINSRINKGDIFWKASVRIHKKSDDKTLIYELVPGSEATREDVRIKINSDGFRDDEFPEQGSNGGRRIVMLGDSVAWGWGVPMTVAFPQLLESHLHKMNLDGESPPIVYNLAVDGYSTEQELRLLERRGLELQPDLVIINYVLNDPDTRDGGLARYYTSDFELLNLARRALNRIKRKLVSSSNLMEYHQQIHAYHKEQISDRFHQLGRISKENDFPILVAIIPIFKFQSGKIYRWQNIHDSLKQLCEQNGLTFIDLVSSFQGKNSSEFSFDQWHPNEDGHAVIAQALAAYLKDFSWK